MLLKLSSEIFSHILLFILIGYIEYSIRESLEKEKPRVNIKKQMQWKKQITQCYGSGYKNVSLTKLNSKRLHKFEKIGLRAMFSVISYVVFLWKTYFCFWNSCGLIIYMWIDTLCTKLHL